MFALADVLDFRSENAERSGTYARMSDAELDLQAMKVTRDEVLDLANQAAIDMSQAQQRMDRHLKRAELLAGQIEVADILIRAAKEHCGV